MMPLFRSVTFSTLKAKYNQNKSLQIAFLVIRIFVLPLHTPTTARFFLNVVCRGNHPSGLLNSPMASPIRAERGDAAYHITNMDAYSACIHSKTLNLRNAI